MIRIMIICLMLTGCEQNCAGNDTEELGIDTERPITDAEGPHPTLAKLSVQVDERSVPMVTALVTASEDTGLSLFVSSKPVTCEALLKSVRPVGQDEVYFRVGATPRSNPQDSQRWEVTFVSFDFWTENANDGSLGEVLVERSTTSRDVHFQLNLNFMSKSVSGYRDTPLNLVAKGSVRAQWCGP